MSKLNVVHITIGKHGLTKQFHLIFFETRNMDSRSLLQLFLNSGRELTHICLESRMNTRGRLGGFEIMENAVVKERQY